MDNTHKMNINIPAKTLVKAGTTIGTCTDGWVIEVNHIGRTKVWISCPHVEKIVSKELFN